LLVVILLGLLTAVVVSFRRRGWVYHMLEKRAPDFVRVLDEMSQQAFSKRKFLTVIGLSVIIEIIGIAHLAIAVKALGGSPTLAMAVIGYAIVLLLLISSPFLRGLGAVEAALTYALTLFGLPAVQALSVAFLFRFFEFWAVLLLGFLAMVAKRDNVVIRMLPAFLLFLLGLVNIFSGITPALPERIEALSRIISLEAIGASAWLVILSGIIMLATSLYLVRGLRNAWITALVLTGISLVGHLAKGIDWEESTIALVTFGSLIYQRHEYFIKPDLKLAKRSQFRPVQLFEPIVTDCFELLQKRVFLWSGGHIKGVPQFGKLIHLISQSGFTASCRAPVFQVDYRNLSYGKKLFTQLLIHLPVRFGNAIIGRAQSVLLAILVKCHNVYG